MFNSRALVSLSLSLVVSLTSSQAVGAPLARLFPAITPPVLNLTDVSGPPADPSVPAEPVDEDNRKFAEECPFATAFTWNDWKERKDVRVIVSLEGATQMGVLSPTSPSVTLCHQTLPEQALLQFVLTSVECAPGEEECSIKPDYSNATPLSVAEYMLKFPNFDMADLTLTTSQDYRPVWEMPETGLEWDTPLFIAFVRIKKILGL